MTNQTSTTTDSPDDHVTLFDRPVPVPALTLLLRLEDEGYDIRVDHETQELCIKPTVPAHERQAITRHKSFLIFMVEQTLALIERERVAAQRND